MASSHTNQAQPALRWKDGPVDQQLTWSHVHAEGALGDPHPSEGDGDHVGAHLCGTVGAAVRVVTFVLHHHLHRVLAALRVTDHGRHVPGAGSCRGGRDVIIGGGAALLNQWGAVLIGSWLRGQVSHVHGYTRFYV